MRAIACIVTAALLAGCGGGGSSGGGSAPPPPPTTPGLARTGCGSFQGTDRGASWAFLGMRYAAAPVGARRWKSPESPSCPATTVVASSFAPVCPQLDRETGAPEGDEDCLAVNVFSPKSAFPAGRAPVMVFIHGGGNVVGSAREEVEPGRVLYDGAALAEATGNVVVTVQYRLGALGWLVHPGLDAEAPDARSGNYALEDLVASLEWVRSNIGAFGGNRDRVMVFGESAGGVNVCTLLASPRATGLFHAALIQSGGCIADARPAALATGAQLAANAGCGATADPVACMRSKSPAELLAALPPEVSVTGARTPYQPSVDGTLLPGAPLDVIRAGQHNRVALAVGANADETGQAVPLAFTEAQYGLFLDATFPNPAVRAAVANLYSVASFGSARRAYVALTSDTKFICPSRSIARALESGQSEPVYRYFFTEVPNAPTSPAFGAFHGLELLYVYGKLDVQGYVPTAAERALSAALQQYWGTLARDGVPVASGQPAWGRYGAGSDHHLVLNADGISMADGVITQRCDFWQSLGL